MGRLTNNQLIARAKAEHGELKGQETERAAERLINILLGLRGYMTGGGVSNGAKTPAGKKEWSVLSCWKPSRDQPISTQPAGLDYLQFLVNYSSTLICNDR